MTDKGDLLDYFAGQALAGMIAHPGSDYSGREFCVAAFGMAEMMLQVREERAIAVRATLKASDRHKPGYMSAYMRVYRAKKKAEVK